MCVSACEWNQESALKVTFKAHSETTLSPRTASRPLPHFICAPRCLCVRVVLAGFKSQSLQKEVARLLATSEHSENSLTG